jgi:hypothetical protein
MSQRPRSVPPASQPPLQPVRVFRVDPGTAWRVRTLSPVYGGLFTHFVKNRSRYCDPAGCRPEYPKGERFWRGYFAAELHDAAERCWRPVVFELTEHCELDMRGVYQRGQVWRVEREADKAGKHAPVRAALEGVVDPAQLPAAWDYRPVLFHLYHVEKLDLSASNPLPPRLMLQATPFVEGGSVAPLEEMPTSPAEWERWRLRRQDNRNGTVPHPA